MSNPRVRKIADRIKVIVAEMLERRVKDPRLGFVTVTDVRVSGDTQQATVFYTVLGEDKDLDGTAVALASAQGADPLRGRQAARACGTCRRSTSSPTRCPRPPGTSTTCCTAWRDRGPEMSNPRVRKIADRIKVIVAEMLERRIKDPRLGFVTVTDVRVSGDTQQATVFYTVLGADEDREGTAMALAVGQGADPLRGRQAARHATRADHRLHRRRAARDGTAHRRPPRAGARGRRRGRAVRERGRVRR